MLDWYLWAIPLIIVCVAAFVVLSILFPNLGRMKDAARHTLSQHYPPEP